MALHVRLTVSLVTCRIFSKNQLRSDVEGTLGSTVVKDLDINFDIIASPSLSSFTEEY